MFVEKADGMCRFQCKYGQKQKKQVSAVGAGNFSK